MAPFNEPAFDSAGKHIILANELIEPPSILTTLYGNDKYCGKSCPMKLSSVTDANPMRPPETVMRPERMGCSHQTRLSFMRALLRQLKRDRWSFERTQWRVNTCGVGIAIYQATGPGHKYSLVCFAHDLPPEERSDRVIAERWDATFALFDGIPLEQDLIRMEANVPLQEAGQCSQTELVLSRANRSVRLFEHVVERLSRGMQPDTAMIENVGYLMRTTAVYGNGKYGLSDRERIAQRPEFAGSFRAELLAVWLIRWFTIDMVEHMARVRDPVHAVTMDLVVKSRLGVGNATGLGMAPFLVNHPALIHSWVNARETALMRVRNLAAAGPKESALFQQMVKRMDQWVKDWHTVDPRQQQRIGELQKDIDAIAGQLTSGALSAPTPWDHMIRWSETCLSLEGQELLVSLVIEPHGALVDDLAEDMTIDEASYQGIDGSMTVECARILVEKNYLWALETDFSADEETARFWYVSEEKLEPRLGERYREPGADREQPLAFGRDIAALHQQFHAANPSQSLAAFLMQYPQHRCAVRRLLLVNDLPYGEIQHNLIATDLVPVDLLRCKLSFFGATRFDPRSDRWIRITMFQNAPFPVDFQHAEPDDWILPALVPS